MDILRSSSGLSVYNSGKWYSHHTLCLCSRMAAKDKYFYRRLYTRTVSYNTWNYGVLCVFIVRLLAGRQSNRENFQAAFRRAKENKDTLGISLAGILVSFYGTGSSFFKWGICEESQWFYKICLSGAWRLCTNLGNLVVTSVFLWRLFCKFPEFADKIADIFKPTVKSNICDRLGGMQKKMAGTL